MKRSASVPERQGPLKCLVLVPTLEDARDLAGLVSERTDLHLLGPFTNLQKVLLILEAESIDLVAVEATSITLSELDRLRAEAHSHEAHLTIFEGIEGTEHTLDVIERVVARHKRAQPRPRRTDGLRVVAVGSSTGGPDALGELIPRLPASFRPAILVAQHMPPAFTPILARRLAERARLTIREAEDGDEMVPGLVLIAPGDYHLALNEDGCSVRIHQGPPENSCRPAADVLFRSVAKIMGPDAIGVVLTGMGRDGYAGARLLRDSGADVVVQDEESSVVWGMPGLIAREGLATRVATLPDIARHLVERAASGPYEGETP